MNRTREAWLAAITAALGCHHDAPTPAADPPEAAPVIVAAAAPSDSAPIAVVPSASPSTSASVAQKTTPPSTASADVLREQLLEALTDQSQSVCGVRVPTGIGNLHNASCGNVPLNLRPTTTPPTPTATIMVSTPGGSDDDHRAITRLTAQLRACATAGLRVNPAEQGAVQLVVAVAANGEVTSVQPSSGSVGAQTQACMAGRVHRAQLTPTGSARSVSVLIATKPQPE